MTCSIKTCFLLSISGIDLCFFLCFLLCYYFTLICYITITLLFNGSNFYPLFVILCYVWFSCIIFFCLLLLVFLTIVFCNFLFSFSDLLSYILHLLTDCMIARIGLASQIISIWCVLNF